MYEEIAPITENGQSFIKRSNEDGSDSYIPIDEANSDYQAYLAWKAEQPTPKAGK